MEDKNQSTGLSLLKKGKKGAFSAIFSRTGLVTALLALNAVLLFFLFFRFQRFLPHYLGATALFVVVELMHLLNSRLDPTAKITWLVIILILPVFGCILYMYTRWDIGHRAVSRRVCQLQAETMHTLPQDAATMEAVARKAPATAALSRYVATCGCHPIYDGTSVTYFPLGEKKWEAMLRELEKAEKFIYLEYFIVEEGLMWGKILEILARKAAQGVDVRVMYDGTCEFVLLPKSYPKRLSQLGIQCRVFAPVTPFVSTHYNYRDHRKIMVIDGKVAFNGGVNLADAYINRGSKYGHWKDTALMLTGPAAQSFTLMFLNMWNVPQKQPDYAALLPGPEKQAATGYVMPYGDSPFDQEHLGQRVYMDILNRAQKYVHIMTPYLILDSELENTLCYCAQRGVDVKLMLPGIPDQWLPHALAKTHFAALVAAGVQVYTYTPGFVHAKVMVSDDREAVVGTINMDYRSLYHHFECATYLLDCPCIGEIEQDFQQTLSACHRVTPDTIKKEKWYTKLAGQVLKAFAPLL